jgi:hypothetical protein
MMVIPAFCLAQSSTEPPKLLYTANIGLAPTVNFGLFKSLTNDQMLYYSAAQTHAVMYAEVNEKVKWQSENVHGYSQVLGLEPASSGLISNTGYCKHVRTVVYGFGQKQSLTQKACHTYSNKSWTWYNLE